MSSVDRHYRELKSHWTESCFQPWWRDIRFSRLVHLDVQVGFTTSKDSFAANTHAGLSQYLSL
jgi:hypothetical protein